MKQKPWGRRDFLKVAAATTPLAGQQALAADASGGRERAGAVVLVNSRAPYFADFTRYIEPYFAHFGVPYVTRDIAREPLGADLDTFALIVIGHRGLDVGRAFLKEDEDRQILAAVHGGSGLVSFDGVLALWTDPLDVALRGRKENPPRTVYRYADEIFGLKFQPFVKQEGGKQVTITGAHYVTRMSETPRTLSLKTGMILPSCAAGPQARVLATCGGNPLLVVANHGRGRALVWTSYEWTKPDVKGKFYGMDDLVWRGLVWAARKPFVMRGMPPLIGMRVDDVVGAGIGANRTLGYVDTANRYGFKPWLGIFLDDIRKDPASVRRLAELTQAGRATASVHSRTWHEMFFVREPFDVDAAGVHVGTRNLSDGEFLAAVEEANRFFAEHRIPRSKYIIPHFSEMGSNAFEGLRKMGGEFLGTLLPPERGYGTPLIQAGPYLGHEPLRTTSVPDPIFIGDWYPVPGNPAWDRKVFNFSVQVRDVAGYEWSPSGVPVEEAIRRGVLQAKRSFESLVPAVLFTHESDHIQHITPENWDRILKGVSSALEPYQPVSVTQDHMAQYARALKSSRIREARFDATTRTGSVSLEGDADLPTKFYVFEGEEPAAYEWEAPAFQRGASVAWRLGAGKQSAAPSM